MIGDTGKLPECKGGVAKELVLALANKPHGADCFAQLLKAGKLNLIGTTITASEAQQLVLDLANAGKNGQACLQLLLEKGGLKLADAVDRDLVLKLAKDRENGADCLTYLLNAGKLNSAKLSIFESAEAKNLVLDLSKGGENGVYCLAILFNMNKLGNLNLDAAAINGLAIKLANVGPVGVDCLSCLSSSLFSSGQLGELNLDSAVAGKFVLKVAKNGGNVGSCLLRMLFVQNKLAKLPILESAEAKDLVLDLSNGGEDGVYCLQLLLNKGYLDKLKDVGADDAKNLVLDLAGKGADGEACLKLLLDTGKLQNLQLESVTDPGEVRAKALELLDQDPPSLDELRELLEDLNNPAAIQKNRIRKAFVGKTDGIGSWASVRTRLLTMHLSEVRGIWQTIANEMAVDCFGADGKVDDAKLKTWMTFLGNVENFKQEPFCLIPHAELMRSQMHRVCECLLKNQNDARTKLDAAGDITPGPHGQAILATVVHEIAGRYEIAGPPPFPTHGKMWPYLKMRTSTEHE